MRKGLAFRYSNYNLTFTARCEIRNQQVYWYAYRRVQGKLHKRYIGKSDFVTDARLQEIALSYSSIERANNFSQNTVCLGELISEHAETLMRNGKITELQVWCAAVPQKMRNQNPELSMWLAWSLCLGDEPHHAEWAASEAEHNTRLIQHSVQVSKMNRLNARSIQTQLALIRGIVARRQKRWDVANMYLRQARKLLPDNDRVLASVIANEQGLNHVFRGELEKAEREFTIAIAHAQNANHALLQVLALAKLATMNYQKGDANQAHDLARHARQIATQQAVELERYINSEIQEWNEHVPLKNLSAREREVLGKLMNGFSDENISRELNISVSTVRWHCKHIYAKLGVHRRTQIIASAYQAINIHQF